MQMPTTIPVRCLMLIIAGVSVTGSVSRADEPFMGAYVNIHKLVERSSSIRDRERVLEEHLDRFQASGLRVVMPYATTTTGTAMYPSEIVPIRYYGTWDPLRFIIRAARARGLQVYPVTCVLACGKHELRGILEQHPEWALRDDKGRRIGHISPCHPQARAWVVSVMREIVEKYKPDGMLLDYLRFNNRPMQLDPHGAAAFKKQLGVVSAADQRRKLQRFKEDSLTELMRAISVELRRQQPGIPLAIYSWGPHVIQNHRVAQDWKTWARKGYINMVNVSGYCYPKNYSDRYLQVFADRMGRALEINKSLGSPIDVTLCLGIKTSHGEIDKAEDVQDYLRIAKRLGVHGTSVFTWTYLQPYLETVKQRGYFSQFEKGLTRRP